MTVGENQTTIPNQQERVLEQAAKALNWERILLAAILYIMLALQMLMAHHAIPEEGQIELTTMFSIWHFEFGIFLTLVGLITVWLFKPFPALFWELYKLVRGAHRDG